MMLRQSLIELLEEKNISKITIKEICERADINRGTFYSHYGDQYELLKEIEANVTAEIMEYISGYSFPADESDSLKMMERIIKYISNNKRLCMILLDESGDRDFVKNLIAIVKKQFIGSAGTQSIKEEYLYCFAAIGSIGLLEKWLRDGMKIPSRDIAGMVIKLSGRGLSAYKS